MRSKSDSASASGGKSIKVKWDKVHAYRTDLFIEWCQDNPTQRVKLFSDSTQDARQEGRTRVQLNAAKKTVYQELARYIFESDPEYSKEWLAKPQAFISATQRNHNNMKLRYNKQVKNLGQTGAGLTIEELENGEKSGVLGKIVDEFPWFPVLHGWWRSNPVCNVVFSTADPEQDFAGDAASIFHMRPEFPMAGGTASGSELNLSAPQPEATALASSSISSGPGFFSNENLNHDLLLPLGESGECQWTVDDFAAWDASRTMDLDLPFGDPSPLSFSTVDPSAILFTGHGADPSAVSFTFTQAAGHSMPVDDLSLNTALGPVPTMLPAGPASAIPPADSDMPPADSDMSPAPPPTNSDLNVISLNDDVGYRPPRRKPLVPSHAETQRVLQAAKNTKFLVKSDSPGVPSTDDSDSDAAAATLFSNLNMKRKTPTPDVSSEESTGKGWFSTDRGPSLSDTAATTSKSAQKRPRLSTVADRLESRDPSASIISAVRALQEQKTVDRRDDRHQRTVAREDRLRDKSKQREHELTMLQQQQQHEIRMVEAQQSSAQSRLREMELQLEIMKFQERLKGQSGNLAPTSGEGIHDFVSD